jgi:hypothetical protein
MRAADITDGHEGECLGFTQFPPLFDVAPNIKLMKDAWLTRPEVPKSMKRWWLCHLICQCFDQFEVEEPIYFCFCRGSFQPRNLYRHCWICHQCQEANSWHCGNCDRCVADFKLRCMRCGGKSEDFGHQTRRAGILRDAWVLSVNLVAIGAISRKTADLLYDDLEGLVDRRWLDDENLLRVERGETTFVQLLLEDFD